jgi:hypothetical protein
MTGRWTPPREIVDLEHQSSGMGAVHLLRGSATIRLTPDDFVELWRFVRPPRYEIAAISQRFEAPAGRSQDQAISSV